jgi:hypothetical protein
MRAALVLLASTAAAGFSVDARRVHSPRRTTAVSMNIDPTSSPFISECAAATLIIAPSARQLQSPSLTAVSLGRAEAINSLQEAFQTSPVANIKKSLAKAQAGSYDEPAIRTKLEGLMAEPAVMFSFTT